MHKNGKGYGSTESAAGERVALHKIDVGVRICSFHCDLPHAALYFWFNGMTVAFG